MLNPEPIQMKIVGKLRWGHFEDLPRAHLGEIVRQFSHTRKHHHVKACANKTIPKANLKLLILRIFVTVAKKVVRVSLTPVSPLIHHRVVMLHLINTVAIFGQTIQTILIDFPCVFFLHARMCTDKPIY